LYVEVTLVHVSGISLNTIMMVSDEEMQIM
jgi:hypothetical protein